MTAPQPLDVVVVGAGIVGIWRPANLAEAGTGHCRRPHRHLRGDELGQRRRAGLPRGVAAGAQGMISQVPKWLADPLGPLAIPPAYLPKITPWLYRFLAGRPGRPASRPARRAGLAHAARRGRDGRLLRPRRRGRHGQRLWRARALRERSRVPGSTSRLAGADRFGIEYRHLERHEIAQYQPGLSQRFVRATFMPTGRRSTSRSCSAATAIWEHAARNGRAEGRGRSAGQGGARARGAAGRRRRFAAGKVVLARRCVVAFPCARARRQDPAGDGARLQHDAAESRLRARAQLAFSATASSSRRWRCRCASAARWSWAASAAARLSPGAGNAHEGVAVLARTEDRRRAAMDGLPPFPAGLAARHRHQPPRSPAVVYAFGHGHLGLTQAAATGRLVRELVSAAGPGHPSGPFSPQRF